MQVLVEVLEHRECLYPSQNIAFTSACDHQNYLLLLSPKFKPTYKKLTHKVTNISN